MLDGGTKDYGDIEDEDEVNETKNVCMYSVTVHYTPFYRRKLQSTMIQFMFDAVAIYSYVFFTVKKES